ncbi:MAG: peptidoglycan DD-metalloendopeptidase family protein [Thermoleophilia bacterium]
MLLPPLLAGAAILCLLFAVAISFAQPGAKADNPLAANTSTPDEIAQQLTLNLEGRPSPADIARAQKPLGERQRLLNAHPYFPLYRIASERFGVSWHLVAAVHYQETGFGEAPKTLAEKEHWKRHRNASAALTRPASYPNRTDRHPSVRDDFDVVMAIAANLERHGARSLGDGAQRALAGRYGAGPEGRLATAMVIERARAWRLLGTLPLPGSGELATPAKGVVGGCGYFGCPRPGHLHNGVDFLAPTGTPIHAADGGIVATVESPGESGGYGNFVCLQHRPHLATCYAHMSAFAAAVRPGARVKRGQVIGLVGSTGHSTAPHLHFEVRRGTAECSACAVDPLPLLSGEVPHAILPQMSAVAPSSRSSVAGPGPGPIARTQAPAPASPSGAQNGGAQAGAPAGGTAGRNRSRRAEPTTGGAAPGDRSTRATPATDGEGDDDERPAAPSTTAPAASPAPAPPQPSSPPQPAGAETGTGGAVPTAQPPPPAPPAPPAPPPPPTAP